MGNTSHICRLFFHWNFLKARFNNDYERHLSGTVVVMATQRRRPASSRRHRFFASCTVFQNGRFDKAGSGCCSPHHGLFQSREHSCCQLPRARTLGSVTPVWNTEVRGVPATETQVLRCTRAYVRVSVWVCDLFSDGRSGWAQSGVKSGCRRMLSSPERGRQAQMHR